MSNRIGNEMGTEKVLKTYCILIMSFEWEPYLYSTARCYTLCMHI